MQIAVACCLLCLLLVVFAAEGRHRTGRHCGPNCHSCTTKARKFRCHRCKEGYHRVPIELSGYVVCRKYAGEIKTPLPISTIRQSTAGVPAPVTDAVVTVQPATHSDVSTAPAAVGTNAPTVATSEPSWTTQGVERILVQQNIDGSAFFDRLWAEYKDGFGDVAGDYWIGNDRLHNLTKDGRYKLRVDVQAKNNSEWYYAEYGTFIVEDESTNYTLHISGYSGNAGDCWTSSDEGLSADGMQFSTRDRENDLYSDGVCATDWDQGDGAGFWYNDCCYGYINAPESAPYGFMWDFLPIGPPDDLVAKKLLVSRVSLLPVDSVF